MHEDAATRLQIGILEAGSPPERIAARFPGYADMVASLLGAGFAARAYDVRAGDLPKALTECDGWVITGSSAGVYDPHPWIATLAGDDDRERVGGWMRRFLSTA